MTSYLPLVFSNNNVIVLVKESGCDSRSVAIFLGLEDIKTTSEQVQDGFRKIKSPLESAKTVAASCCNYLLLLLHYCAEREREERERTTAAATASR